MMLLSTLQRWAPFKIDALGLVTLLGAEDVNHAIGTLSRNHIAEYLPLVGGHVLASDSIRKPLTGFTLYNISDGICASDVTPWFARWLQAQHVTYNTTTLSIDCVPSPRGVRRIPLRALAIGLTVNMSLVGFSILLRDWWGLATALALVTAVILRAAMVGTIRQAVDGLAQRALCQNQELVKALCTLPDGSSVLLYTFRGLVTECLLTNPKPRHRRVYNLLKVTAWIAFIIHIISIGMASLPTQLLIITAVAASTVCCITGAGADREYIGTRLRVRRVDLEDQSQSMAFMYASLCLVPNEESCLVSWRLMPSRTNQLWWTKYRNCLERDSPTPFKDWKDKKSWSECDGLLRGIEMQHSIDLDRVESIT